MGRTLLLFGLLGAAAASATVPGCSSQGSDCAANKNCTNPPDSGAGAGGTSGNATGGGGGNTGGTSGGSSGAGGTAPCNGTCGGATPVCDTASDTCVECVGNGDCSDPKPACDTGTNTCVECTENTDCPSATPFCNTAAHSCAECLSSGDCTDAAAARCDAGQCKPCTAKSDCSNITGKNVCETNSGECVQCTQADSNACGTNPCTTKNVCSAFGTNRQTCQSCDTDANCISADNYCVPMKYKGTDRPDGYCLQNGLVGGCDQPFTVALTGRTTLSGFTGGTYCGVNETLTTCEAVRALQSNQACPNSTDAECPEGGLCRIVGLTTGMHCTYACGGAASTCLAPPAAGSTCGPGSASTGPDFCGG